MIPARISLIIPAYNEERRLPKTLKSIVEFSQREKELIHEIILINDGSTDKTGELIENFAKEIQTLKACHLPINSGKGAAIKEGVLLASGDWILLFDADGATSIQTLLQFLKYSDPRSKILIGSREVEGAERIIPQPLLRRQAGKVFIGLRKIMIGLKDIQDTNCGFKLIQRDIAQMLFSDLTFSDYLFDLEILTRARILGIEIREIGVKWKDQPDSKIKLTREIPRSLYGLFKLRRSLKIFKMKHRDVLKTLKNPSLS